MFSMRFGLFATLLCSCAAPFFSPTISNAQTSAPTATIQLGWEVPTNTAGITGYRVYVRSVTQATYPSTYYSVSGAGTRTITITDKPAGAYYFVVKSFNGSVESLPSNETAAIAVPVTMQGRTLAQTNGAKVQAQVYRDAATIVNVDTTVNANGIITIPMGTNKLTPNADVKVDAPNFLAAYVQQLPLSPIGSMALRGGDVNNDGTVNSVDYGYLKAKWLTLNSGAEDVFQDGQVNSLDYGILKSNWSVSEQL